MEYWGMKYDSEWRRSLRVRDPTVHYGQQVRRQPADSGESEPPPQSDSLLLIWLEMSADAQAIS